MDGAPQEITSLVGREVYSNNGVYVGENGETYRMVQVSEETVVVLAGNEEFTTQAQVSGGTEEVVIEHTGSDQTRSDSVEDDDDEVVVAGNVHVRPAA